MAMTKTKTGEYLNRMAQGGHFKQKLGETALSLTECFCKADMHGQRKMGELLVDQVFVVLREVYGWNDESSRNSRDRLVESFQQTGVKK